MNREKVEWQFFDEAMQADVERLGSVHPGEISMVGRDRDDKVWLVAFSGDTSTTLYYVYDRASGATRFFFSTQPSLDDYTLAPMQPISFESRDGLTIHGYLSTPVGPEPNELADGLVRPRRPLGAGLLGTERQPSVARQPGLRRLVGELSRLHGLRQGVSQRRQPRVGREDARRPGGRG